MQPSNPNAQPDLSPSRYTLPPKEKAERQARADRLAQAVLDGLNRHTTSEPFLRNRYRYLNPKASDEEIEMLVRADALAGHPPEFLTIEQARTIVTNAK